MAIDTRRIRHAAALGGLLLAVVGASACGSGSGSGSPSPAAQILPLTAAPAAPAAAAVPAAPASAGPCSGVTVSRQQMLIGSTQASQGGQPLPAGAVVSAVGPSGTRVGCVVLTTAGQFRLVINADDTSGDTNSYLHAGDPIQIQVNGRPVPPEDVTITDTSITPPPGRLIYQPGTPVQYALVTLSV